MKKLYRILDSIRSVAIIAVTVFTVGLCLLQIVLRYFTFISARPFAWGDEILRLTSIWSIFLGISIGVRENAHFAVTIVKDKAKGTFGKVYSIIIDLIVMFTLAVVFWEGFKYTKLEIHSFLQNIRISIAFFYASMPVGAFYCFIEFLYKYLYGPDYKTLMKEGR